jgi:imidazoleglycerol phosphate dehydratase HisB
MKVAILGAGCYRTHAASGITNFSRACEVADITGKENIAMTHSTIEMGAELLELAGVDEVVVSDPVFDGEFTTSRIGDLETEMIKEFFYAVSYSCGMNLHIKVLNSGNNHHMAEAMFKAFGKALDEATTIDPRITDILSTKGSL